jgi:uncharacterized protein (DUF2147 family)
LAQGGIRGRRPPAAGFWGGSLLANCALHHISPGAAPLGLSPRVFNLTRKGMLAMKTLCIVATLALLAGSAAHAGSIMIGGSGLKVEDCGTDICGRISLGKRKFIVKKSEISSVLKDFDFGDRLPSAKRGKNPAMADRTTRVKTALAAHNEYRTPPSRRREEPADRSGDPPAHRDEERPGPAAKAKGAVEQEVATSTPVPAPVASDPNGPIGEWTVEGSGGRVQIRPCGKALCGIVSAAKNPNDTDRNNADASKRNRPVIGMPVLIDMKPTKKDRWEGQVYNANDGKTYAANIAMKKPNVLRVEGCALGGLACGGQNWTRAKDVPQE